MDPLVALRERFKPGYIVALQQSESEPFAFYEVVGEPQPFVREISVSVSPGSTTNYRLEELEVPVSKTQVESGRRVLRAFVVGVKSAFASVKVSFEGVDLMRVKDTQTALTRDNSPPYAELNKPFYVLSTAVPTLNVANSSDSSVSTVKILLRGITIKLQKVSDEVARSRPKTIVTVAPIPESSWE